jgi:histidinol-phosphatase (PHP family)
MGKSNLHTHCFYCDGRGRPEEYILSALKLGFSSLGFSSHAPLPFDTDWDMKETDVKAYLKEIDTLKNKYKDRLTVYRGMEIDYIKDFMAPNDGYHKALKLDYCIGSVHVLYDENRKAFLSVDGPADEYTDLLLNTFSGSMEKYAQAYYKALCDMALNFRPDIIGHLDLIKKNNTDECFFSENEDWYKKLLPDVLAKIKASGSIMEINTGGLARKRTKDLYPSGWLIELAYENDIPVIINSDCHNPEQLDYYFTETTEILKKCGYRQQLQLINGSFETAAL